MINQFSLQFSWKNQDVCLLGLPNEALKRPNFNYLGALRAGWPLRIAAVGRQFLEDLKNLISKS